MIPSKTLGTMRRTCYLVCLLLQKGVYPENLPLFRHASSKSASFFLFNLFMCFDFLHRFVCAFILRRKMRGIIFTTTPSFLRQSKGWTAESSQWLEPYGKPLAVKLPFLKIFSFLTHLLARSMVKEPWSKPAFVSAAKVYVALCFMELPDQSNTVLDSILWRIILFGCASSAWENKLGLNHVYYLLWLISVGQGNRYLLSLQREACHLVTVMSYW